MRQLLIILTLGLIGCQTEVKTSAVDFETTIYNLNDPTDSVDFAAWQKAHLAHQSRQYSDTLFSQDSIPVGKLCYEDDQYLVYTYCAGEFGGALMFQDRELKDSIYYLESNCAVMIDKRDDGYYLTEALAHMSGSGKVQFFKTPKELVKVHLDSLVTEWKRKKYAGITDHHIWEKLENQGTVLIDTMGLTFSMCFPYGNENYLIFSDFKNTYLGLLTSGSIKPIDTLLNLPTWRYNNPLNDKINGYYHYNFQRLSGNHNDKINTVSSGDIYAKSNSIVIAIK